MAKSVNKRLQKELQSLNLSFFKKMKVDDEDSYKMEGLLIPDKEPYNKGGFWVDFVFPAEYPFKPPKITFRTKIYHPNISEKGEICFAMIDAANWKPTIRISSVIEALQELVNTPEPAHPLRPELAQEYVETRKRFLKRATESVSIHAVKLD